MNSNITQIPTIHIYVKETCVVKLSTHQCLKLKFTYRVFTEFINLFDVGENFINTKKQTIKLLHEHRYRYKSKLCIENFCGNFSRRNVLTSSIIRVKIQLGKHFDS